MNAKITVTITPGKSMQVDVQGAQGSTCADLTKPLEQMGVIESQEFKPEYFESNINLNSSSTLNQQGF